MSAKLIYGIKDGKALHIDRVTNGLSCNCTCSGCGSKLVAKNGGTENVHHFAHFNSDECEYGLESALHHLAKQFFLSEQRIKVPKVLFAESIPGVGSKTIELFGEQYIPIQQATLEYRIESIIPDIVLEINGKTLLVEIAVSHFVDKVKASKIKALQLSTIEINLSHMIGNWNEQEVKHIILHSTFYKSWIYNRKLEQHKIFSEEKNKEIEIEKLRNSTFVIQTEKDLYDKYKSDERFRVIGYDEKLRVICPKRKQLLEELRISKKYPHPLLQKILLHGDWDGRIYSGQRTQNKTGVMRWLKVNGVEETLIPDDISYAEKNEDAINELWEQLNSLQEELGIADPKMCIWCSHSKDDIKLGKKRFVVCQFPRDKYNAFVSMVPKAAV